VLKERSHELSNITAQKTNQGRNNVLNIKIDSMEVKEKPFMTQRSVKFMKDENKENIDPILQNECKSVKAFKVI